VSSFNGAGSLTLTEQSVTDVSLVVHEISKALDDVDLASTCGHLAGRSGNPALLVEVPKNHGFKKVAVDSHRPFEAHRLLQASCNRSVTLSLVVDATTRGLLCPGLVF